MDNPLYDYPVAVLLGLSAKALIRIEAMLPQGFQSELVCFALANAHNWPALTTIAIPHLPGPGVRLDAGVSACA